MWPYINIKKTQNAERKRSGWRSSGVWEASAFTEHLLFYTVRASPSVARLVVASESRIEILSLSDERSGNTFGLINNSTATASNPRTILFFGGGVCFCFCAPSDGNVFFLPSVAVHFCSLLPPHHLLVDVLLRVDIWVEATRRFTLKAFHL